LQVGPEAASLRYREGLSVRLRRLGPVLSTIDLRGSEGPGVDYATAVPRAAFDVAAAVERVLPICADVAARGEAALAEYSERFDRVVPEHFRVPASALEQAAAGLDLDLRKAFEISIARRRTVSAAELGEAEVRVELAPGAVVTQRMIAVNRVGLYVPGGLAPLASSVIMNVVPAQVAGVRSIALSSPPQREFGGLPHPSILAVCHLLGIDEVYAVGGAHAIAMFAYGVPGLCDRVDLVTGPGNIYVVAAKRALKGRVNIDSEAGPTEIAILADATADPVHVAADLISQAEHDPLAAAVLVTDSEELAEAVRGEVERQVPETKHSERIGQSLAGKQSAIVLVRDVDQGIEVVDAYAAEHLEIHTVNAAEHAGRIRNAGAIFVGGWSPVSLGDYAAGSTHVLPTGGCACHSSGLNVKSFLKAVHVIDYSREALAEIARDVEVFADAEDLPAHGAAISRRFSS
jgi:histidinol dehydrogenase